MRRTTTALASLALAMSPALAASGIAYAADDEGAQSPPTTIDVETSTVERTVTTLDVSTVTAPDVAPVTAPDIDTDTDDDSDKTGLWGLLGLLGLLGLAGLARKKRDNATYPAGTVQGDTTARGASTSAKRDT